MNLLLFNLKTDADDTILGFTTDWINALAKKCDRVIVITMYMGRLAVADNVKVFSVGKEKGYSELRRLIVFYRLLADILRTEHIDACFAHMIQIFAILSWPLLRLKKIPIVLWYAHSHVPFSLRVATRLVDRVVASSPHGFRIKTNKYRSIGQGIDTDRFVPAMPKHNLEKDEPTAKLSILTVGRISPVKRLEIGIDSIALLPSDVRSGIELRYVGDPPNAADTSYKNQLEQQVQRLGLEGTVFFQPALPFHQVQKAYQAADIFINTSDTDSMDKTLLEAMSCGLPVVTSNLSFKTVLGEDLATKWFIPKNDPTVLAERLKQLIEMTPEERYELGGELRSIVQTHHSLPALSTRLLDNVIQKIECH